jgi:glycine hydroxymethyltransferase
VLGGPLPHAIAAKAVAFAEAARPEFKTYAARIVQNAQSLAAACMAEGMEVLTGGTDNHLMLVDVAKTFGLTGRQAESALRACGFTLNRNALPFDPNGPWYTSGLRIGTPAVTTLGMGADEMKEIARIAKRVLANTAPAPAEGGKKSQAKYNLDEAIVQEARKRVQALLDKHPLYPELDLEIPEASVSGQ